jgi:hypothetical protein
MMLLAYCIMKYRRTCFELPRVSIPHASNGGEAAVLTKYIEPDGGTTRSMCFDHISPTMDERGTEAVERDSSRPVPMLLRKPVTFRSH